jgi:hypothetical protein
VFKQLLDKAPLRSKEMASNWRRIKTHFCPKEEKTYATGIYEKARTEESHVSN